MNACTCVKKDPVFVTCKQWKLTTAAMLVQVNSIVLAAAVTFPTTIDSAAANSSAQSLYSALNTNPGSVYTASNAALLTSATVAITNASLATSTVAPRAATVLPTGKAPVQFLLSGNSTLACDPTCVAVAGRKLLASEQAGGLMTKLQDSWQAMAEGKQRHSRRRGLVALPCCTTAPASIKVMHGICLVTVVWTQLLIQIVHGTCPVTNMWTQLSIKVLLGTWSITNMWTIVFDIS